MVTVVWTPVVERHEIIVHAVNTNQQHTTHRKKTNLALKKINVLYHKTSCCQMLYKIEKHVLKHYLFLITKGKATFQQIYLTFYYE
jgi:hypothetical protein